MNMFQCTVIVVVNVMKKYI